MIQQALEPARYFNLIHGGLAEANRNSGEYVSIGQIYDALLSGNWTLWIFRNENSNEYIGFGITEEMHTANGIWINVPFSYSTENMYTEFFTFLADKAHEMGMVGVKFISSRPGFEKKAKEFGWKKGFTEWIVTDFRGSK
jgi:hypothetical protein